MAYAQSGQAAQSRQAERGLSSPQWSRRTSRLTPGDIPASTPLRRAIPSTSLRSLDLRRIPSEAELRLAGDVGGLSFPTGNADVTRLVEKMNRLPLSADEKRLKIQRLQTINRQFGQASELWNQHQFEASAELLALHIKQFPDSPWSAEAKLKLGKQARYTGRYNEAETFYREVFSHSQADPAAPTYDVHMKAAQYWTELEISRGNFREASQNLKQILQVEIDPLRIAWARHWLRNVGLYQRNADDLLACGTQALGAALAQLGYGKAAGHLASLETSEPRGFSLAQLASFAGRYGLKARGFQAVPNDLASLPMPLILHFSKPALGVSDSYPTGLRAKIDDKPGHVFPATRENKSSGGHFVVAERVDSSNSSVLCLDPSTKKRFALSFAQLRQEWTGKGLLLEQPRAKIRYASRLLLSGKQMQTIMGGSGDLAGQQQDLGDSENLQNGQELTHGLSWAVNHSNMNFFVANSVIGYSTPIGPDVAVSLSYNSQDAYNQNTVFGRKWTSNYGSYLKRYPDGSALILMPDGEQLRYGFDGSKFVAPAGTHDTLNQVADNRFELVSDEGDKCIYDVPSGSNATVSFLVELRDRWNQSVTLGYDSATIQLRTITDAQGRVTKLFYDNLGQVRQIDDPFGRRASLTYVDGNLVESTDMAAQTTQFVYDADAQITQILTEQGNWLFDPRIPARDTVNEQYLKVTDPLNKSQYFACEREGGPVSSADERGFTSKFNVEQIVGGRGKLTHVKTPSGDVSTRSFHPVHGSVTAAKSPLGKSVTLDYNPKGNLTYFRDAKLNPMRINYAANGVDVASLVNSRSETEVVYSDYNAQHQPGRIVNAEGEWTTMTYTDWGALATVTDVTGTTIYHHDPQSKLLMSVEELSGQSSRVVASYTYNRFGEVATSTDLHGLTTRYEYDAGSGDLTLVVLPDTSQIEYEYVAPGLMGMVFDHRDNTRTFYDYDAMQRLRRVQDAAGSLTRYYYDAAGNQTRLLDANGNSTVWRFDNLNRVTKKIFADGNYQAYSYDADGRLETRRTPNGKLTRYTYDDNANLTYIDYPISHDVSFEYNDLDELTEMRDAVGTTTFGYDRIGRLNSEDGPWENDTVSYKADAAGRREWMKINGVGVAGYQYDAWSRLQYLSSPAGRFEYQYFGNTSLVKALVRPNGFSSTFEYDNLKRLSKQTEIYDKGNAKGHVIKTVGRNSINKIKTVRHERETRWVDRSGTAQVSTTEMTYENQYDKIGQWIGHQGTTTYFDSNPSPFTWSEQHSLSKQFDPTGNLLFSKAISPSYEPTPRSNESLMQSESNGLNQLYETVDSNGIGANALDSNAVTKRRYDANGNQIAKAVSFLNTTHIYTYDDEDRLIKYSYDDKSAGMGGRPTIGGFGDSPTISEYLYDGLGRLRISRDYVQDYTQNYELQIEKHRVYDGMLVIQERNQFNAIHATYTRGLDLSGSLDGAGGIGGLLAQSWNPPATIHNTLKSYVLPAGHYSYVIDMFSGDAMHLLDTTLTSGTSTSSRWQPFHPYWFQSKEHLAPGVHFGYRILENDYYRFGYRILENDYYSWRWLTRDPLEEAGGLNLYAYCDNDPINKIDPWGLSPHDVEEEAYLGRYEERYQRTTRKTVRTGAKGVEWGFRGYVEVAGTAMSGGTSKVIGLVGRGIGAVGRGLGAGGRWVGGLFRRRGVVVGVSRRAGQISLKRVNLPSWKTIAIDMEHIADRHMAGGKSVSDIKDLFPSRLSHSAVEKAIRQAYRGGHTIRASQGSRVFMEGQSGGLRIQMWVNRATKEIETAWPVLGRGASK